MARAITEKSYLSCNLTSGQAELVTELYVTDENLHIQECTTSPADLLSQELITVNGSSRLCANVNCVASPNLKLLKHATLLLQVYKKGISVSLCYYLSHV